MNKLIYTDSLLSMLSPNRQYTKSDIENILNYMQADYDKDVASRRILHFSGLVSQNTLLNMIDVISDTNKPSLYD